MTQTQRMVLAKNGFLSDCSDCCLNPSILDMSHTSESSPTDLQFQMHRSWPRDCAVLKPVLVSSLAHVGLLMDSSSKHDRKQHSIEKQRLSRILTENADFRRTVKDGVLNGFLVSAVRRVSGPFIFIMAPPDDIIDVVY